MYPVVQVAIVEGDQHGTRGHGLAGQVAGELGGRQRLVARARQPRNLCLEDIGSRRDHAARGGDMVVHQHGNVGRVHAARSATHFR
ncbi:hypothetical protein D3C72_2367590 [compost metagenome]